MPTRRLIVIAFFLVVFAAFVLLRLTFISNPMPIGEQVLHYLGLAPDQAALVYGGIWLGSLTIAIVAFTRAKARKK